MVTAKIDL